MQVSQSHYNVGNLFCLKTYILISTAVLYVEYWVSLLGKQTQLPTLDIHISTGYSYHIWGNSDGQGCGTAQGPLRAIL